ncbi:MAG: hypothetical protein DRQ54_00110 [Gammaproteobacteria bacterium]|nr:MAG: hypothetical protein DRQ54_00110 [Gammaproteobacteria bacterium]RLA15889.1 MAG: hypothetical protein DRQ52_00705 [Gammaproteobacteria bacterium]
MYYEVGVKQIQGGRDYQEDCYQVFYPDAEDVEKKRALVVLADGMGGHAGGAVASEIVVEGVVDIISKQYPVDNSPSALFAAMDGANRAVLRRAREEPELQGMGCTLVALTIDQNELHWISVGDSLLYLIRGGEVIRKNDDHSYGGYVDRLIAAGEDIPATPGFKPRRNMLMSYVNGEEVAMIDCPDEAHQIQAGDRLIVASDGLDTISSDDFPFLSKNAATPQALADALVGAVEAAGKSNQDNTTVVVVDVIGSGGDDTDQETPGDWVGDSILAGLDEDTAQDITTAVDQTVEEEGVDILAVELPAKKGDSNPLPGDGGANEPVVAVVQSASESGNKKVTIISVVIVGLLLIAGGYFFLSGERSAPVTAGGSDQARSQRPTVSPKQPQAKPSSRVTEAVVPVAQSKSDKQLLQNNLQDELKNGAKGPLLVVLHAGKFTQGSSSLSPIFGERPARQVVVPGFAMSVNEITFMEYGAFAAAVGRRRPADMGWGRNQRPVINVSWDDARAYVAWLSTQTGHRYRLPSESEWEYAARAGTTEPYWWGREAGDGRANCWGCGSKWDGVETAPVGSFSANPWGLHDTAGNVLEWVSDCMHKNYVNAPVDGSSWQQTDCEERVIRGGSWSNPADNGRVAKRGGMGANVRQDNLGFRVVRELD